MFRNKRAIATHFIALTLLSLARVYAADPISHATVLAPYVNDDTLALAYIDVASLNAANIGELFSLVPKLPDLAQAEMGGFMIVSSWIKSFQEVGGQGLYVLGGLGDIHIDGGPLLIATTQPGKQPEDVEHLIESTVKQFPGSRSAAGPMVQRKGDTVLVGMKSTIARYGKFQATRRNELIDPLTKLTSEGSVAAVVFCPGADYRRVSRELWPDLPGSLAPLRGELADRWLYITAAINLPPNPNPRIALQAKDPDAAEVFAKLWRNLPTETTEFGGNQKAQEQVKGYAQLLVDSLPAQLEGTRVEIRVPTDESHISKLSAMFAEATKAGTESTIRRRRFDQFKTIAIAMSNYESAKKRLPAAAIYDKAGKPLLSWRVAILPYLDENNLYKQFHLNEPWDSPHNRSLIGKMPDVFRSPSPDLQKLNGEGKTTYQVPVGRETVFYSPQGTTMHEIKNGTSNTVLVVEVEPLHAAYWTN